jgi:MoxR-like ATPase
MATSTLPSSGTSAANRSCGNCPARLDINKQRISPGKSIGAPVCGIKLIPLSRPGGPEEKTFKHFAKDCKQYGTEIELEDTARQEQTPILYQISFPDPGAQLPTDPKNEPVTTCATCVNYVPGPVTRKLTGYMAGYCRAKGALLLDDRLTKYAANCEDRKFAAAGQRVDETNRRSHEGIKIILYPEYDLNFGKPKPIDIDAIHQLNLRIKPSEYPTDREVTVGQKLLGIRAFRRIQDPAMYGPPIPIPIMDEMAVDREGNRIFSDADRARIPRTGDDEAPEAYYDHNGIVYKTAIMWRLGLTPALWGPAGVGKTEAMRHIAWMMGMPFLRISVTESSELDDLFGKMMYEPSRGTYFQYGRIPLAWMAPNIFCLDEPNTGSPAVWQAIRPMTDNSKQLVLDQNSGERIPKHRLCYLGMAMNPAWDIRNTGVAPLADADGSRLMHIEMDLPPEHVERKILHEVLAKDGWDLPDANQAIDKIMPMAKEIRGLAESGAIPFSWGIRNQQKVLRIKRFARWVDAFRMGVTDSLEPDVRELVLQVVKAKAGNED